MHPRCETAVEQLIGRQESYALAGVEVGPSGRTDRKGAEFMNTIFRNTLLVTLLACGLIACTSQASNQSGTGGSGPAGAGGTTTPTGTGPGRSRERPDEQRRGLTMGGAPRRSSPTSPTRLRARLPRKSSSGLRGPLAGASPSTELTRRAPDVGRDPRQLAHQRNHRQLRGLQSVLRQLHPLDASAYTGIKFTISGSLGGGALTMGIGTTLNDAVAASWLIGKGVTGVNGNRPRSLHSHLWQQQVRPAGLRRSHQGNFRHGDADRVTVWRGLISLVASPSRTLNRRISCPSTGTSRGQERVDRIPSTSRSTTSRSSRRHN